MHTITTIGQLKKSGYQTKTIKQELRDNLIASLKSGKKTFNGIIGYDTSVIPDVERAILSKHNILLLGFARSGKNKDCSSNGKFAG
jgi:magnesium chelatase subunit I